ncbi:probable receptor-like protein kinase At2g23200 [Dendrobium catenatum]|uniref:non-specific serine/threonine protein kinase n=1 Tax=Dendrobium catenatum TaxID=906689 RepID=A0A2I0WVV7_9ASPA|nr:probable receptor-like protein kinase At2g23200 [Dendrobium catenatum]PKU79781.1 putative receptor-like protein kinase [Dendrobium catenatum]
MRNPKHYRSSGVAASSADRTPKSSASRRLNLDLQISYSEVIFATNNFEENLFIGAAGFSKVYKGVLGDGTKVAVKRDVPGSRQGYPEFQTEIVVLSRIRHQYLVSLIGYCEDHSEMILVYEYIEKRHSKELSLRLQSPLFVLKTKITTGHYISMGCKSACSCSYY